MPKTAIIASVLAYLVGGNNIDVQKRIEPILQDVCPRYEVLEKESREEFTCKRDLSWREILDEKLPHIDPKAARLLWRQYSAFVAGTVPPIAAPEIKAIPIIENGEELVDIQLMGNKRITMLPDNPEGKPFASFRYNAGFPSSSKIRCELYDRVEEMVDRLDDRAELFDRQPEEACIEVFEGLRDLETQAKIFRQKMRQILHDNPELSAEEAERRTAVFVSPVKNNVPVHSTGGAIDMDLSLCKDRYRNNGMNPVLEDSNMNRRTIDMGEVGGIWGDNSKDPLFAENITTEQKYNRLWFASAAAEAGITIYPPERWHGSYGDRYAAFWDEDVEDSEKVAIYGAIKESQ